MEAKEIMQVLAREDSKPESITFQAQPGYKPRLEALALKLGYSRFDKKAGQDVGNVSQVLNQLIAFSFARLDLLSEWIGEQIAQAIQE